MFNHLIQLLRARRAFRAGRLEAALSLLEDPLVRDDRRAQQLKRKVFGAMLTRVSKRIEACHLTSAERDLELLRRLDPDLPQCDELAARLAVVRRTTHEQSEHEEQLRRGFETALEEGRLHEARQLLVGLEGRIDDATIEALRTKLGERRLAASEVLRQVRDHLDGGREREAREGMERARRLCADSMAFRDRLLGLSAAWAKERWDQVQSALAAGCTLDAARALADWWDSEPDSEDLQEARDLLVCVADRLAAQARGLAEKGHFDQAMQLVCQAPPVVSKINALRRVREQLEQIDTLLASKDEDPRIRLQGLTRLRAETAWKKLDLHLEELHRLADELEASLKRAREALSGGDTQGGKELLDQLLTRWPGCEEARAALEGLLADQRERAQQLEAARAALRDGLLLEAQRHLFRLVNGGYGSEEARSLLRDVERLRGKVSREVARLAARLAAGIDPDEVLAHVVKLRRSQSDSPELADLEAAALRRRKTEEREQAVRASLEARDPAQCLQALRDWVADGGDGGIAAEERRRLVALGSDIDAVLRREIARGYPAFVREIANGLRTWQSNLEIDLEPLLATAKDRIAKARDLAERGLEALDAKRSSQADALLEEAREIARDEPRVLRLAHRLKSVERDRRELERAFELADSDRAAARDRLASMGPTPRPLGSLVLEVRDRIERSGHLEDGCILEVEEAGEFLLFTDDRICVGNATGRNFPHVPVLARIKPHHATLVRSVSFHGGVNDHIESVNGNRVTVNGGDPRTSLKHGDKLLLGDVLPLTYLRPCPRSASVLMRIEKGFESRGSTRILWIKQGGKDGRVLIGRGKEVHIRVRETEPELYLWSPGRGALHVSFAGAGEIDGISFTGDRPLAPGATVACGSIRFRVRPF